MNARLDAEVCQAEVRAAQALRHASAAFVKSSEAVTDLSQLAAALQNCLAYLRGAHNDRANAIDHAEKALANKGFPFQAPDVS